MTSTDHGMLTTQEPYRVTLPPLERIAEPTVREAARRYFALHDEWIAKLGEVRKAERALLDAEHLDELATSQALEEGRPTPNPRAEAKKALELLDDERARLAAYRTALIRLHANLSATAAEHRDAWAEQTSVDHAAAVDRLRTAQTAMQAAERDLVYTGSLLNMLKVPGKVTAGLYRPAAVLQLATQAGTEAVDVVTEHAA